MSSSAVSTLASSKITTPVKQTPPAARDSPGNWRHPRLAEITQRRSRTVFSEKNARSIAYNTAALLLALFVRSAVYMLLPASLLKPPVDSYVDYGYAACLLIPLTNIGMALMPIFRAEDNLEDIPLTPSQRKLLGLPPSSKKATPGTVYSTPPRYSRTPSLAGTPASNKSYSSSPLSGKGSPASNIRLNNNNNSPYSPIAASPLLQKTVVGGVAGARRSSFGSPSPLGAAVAANLFGGDNAGTPSPSSGKRSSVGLNSKWLYEKGRRTSSNSWLHQNMS